MKLKNVIASLVMAGFIVSTRPSFAGESKVSGNIGYIHSGKKDNSYVEANVFYKIPAEIRGFTFLDFYRGNGGYFGRTTLDRRLLGSFNVSGQVIHVNELCTQAGIGFSFDIPKMPKNTFANLSLIPFWNIGDRDILSYYAGVNLPYDFLLKCFGDINLATSNGLAWEYGEAELSKKIGKNTSIGYNAALRNDGNGKLIPTLENRVCIRFDF